jgi:hypothetical protein
VDGFALWNENCNQSQRSIVLFWGNLPSCEIYHPCHNFRSEMCSDSLKERQIPSVFFIPNLAPLMAADSDTILGVFGGSASTGGPGPSLGLQFQGLIVSRYKVTTGVGGRNGKKHSGNSV